LDVFCIWVQIQLIVLCLGHGNNIFLIQTNDGTTADICNDFPLQFSMLQKIKKEAQLSQVINEYITVPLEETVDSVLLNGHILIAEHTGVSETFFEKIFPKETHYEKKEESLYSEHINKYQIKEILKSDTFKVGEMFWTWEEPAYSLSDIKKYHESNFLPSPIILQYEPNYPADDGKKILFIDITDKKNEIHSEIYIIIAHEGIEAKDEIVRILKRKDWKWWHFWKWPCWKRR